MTPAPEYVLARRVLLDALEGLAGHRDAIVVVGAQAIYLNVGDADLAVAPMTTDGDLAIDPRRLADIPVIGEAMAAARFAPAPQPGSWIGSGGVMIDLMVPAALARSPGRRSVDLGVHGRLAARLTPGLEATVVDHETCVIRSLEDVDTRAFDVRVAGPAALLVAKLHKLGERLGTRRMQDKDALDVLRLLRGPMRRGWPPDSSPSRATKSLARQRKWPSATWTPSSSNAAPWGRRWRRGRRRMPSPNR